jgi:hypothetical protein
MWKGVDGSPKINPKVGTPQAEIFHLYKIALIRATAIDEVTIWI